MSPEFVNNILDEGNEMESLICKHWHHCPAEEVTTLLTTHPDRGLSLFEAKKRLEHFGPNMVTAKNKKGLSSGSCCSFTSRWFIFCWLPPP